MFKRIYTVYDCKVRICDIPVPFKWCNWISEMCFIYMVNTIYLLILYKPLFLPWVTEKITKEPWLSLETQSYSVHMLADALKAFHSFIQVTLPNISRSQWCPFILPPHTPDTWLSPPNGVFLPLSLPPFSLSSSILSDCNYLIIPEFITHWPRLAFSRSLCLSFLLQPVVSPWPTCRCTSTLWRSQFKSR